MTCTGASALRGWRRAFDVMHPGWGRIALLPSWPPSGWRLFARLRWAREERMRARAWRFIHWYRHDAPQAYRDYYDEPFPFRSKEAR